MNKKIKVPKTNEQLKNEQLGILLGQLEKDIEYFWITIEKKRQTIKYKFSKILKATKIECQKVSKKNKSLKNYIL